MKSKISFVRNGIIYSTINLLLNLLNYINLSELLKAFFRRIVKKDPVLGARIGTDIYMFLKWGFIIHILCNGSRGIVLKIFVWYLIISNIYTFFYRYVWTLDSQLDLVSNDRQKRRFLHLLLAVSFNIICFAYLFAFIYTDSFIWSGSELVKDSLYFSVANSLMFNISNVIAGSVQGERLLIIELVFTFIFLTIILNNSIPNPIMREQE